jgi:hypothetical protein
MDHLKLMAEECELLGHSDEYWIDAHGLCVYCKSINPRFED